MTDFDDDKNDSNNESKGLVSHYGSAVSGELFWPRPLLVDDLVETLLTGESVSLFGLRRIGKSSLMQEAARLISEQKSTDDYVVIEIDAQDFSALDKILTEILLKLPQKSAFDALKNKLMTNKYLPETIKGGFELLFNTQGGKTDELAKHLPNFWQLICDEITAAVKQSGTQLILMIDEFPYMCKNLLVKENGVDFVDTLLATFRQWRAGPITMVISGSIGMQHLVREHQLEFVHFNDCIPFDIPPLASELEAKAMVEALVNGAQLSQWTEQTTQVMLAELSAFYPSFIQFAFSRMKAARAFTPFEIEELFAEQIRPRWDSTFFDQFDIRLKAYDSLQRDTALKVFAVIAKAKNGTVKQNDFVDVEDLGMILKLLAEDGFLRRRQQRDGSQSWRFSSPLIDIWWAQTVNR